MPLSERLSSEWRLLIYDTTKPRVKRSLRQLLEEAGAWSPAFKRMFQVLFDVGCKDGAKCQTVVVETQYVDRDYADAYGKLYGRSFHAYRRFPYRLHFFGQPLKSALELHIKSPESEPIHLKRLQDNYLGFSVIRPSEPDAIGRTVIAPPCSQNQNCFILCQEEFSLNLAGLPLKAKGCPFMQQDGMVGACATAAVWMAHMALYKRHGLSTFSTTLITELADATYPAPQRVFPSEGLSIEQIGVALKRMGHETILVNLRDTPPEELRRWLYSYVESEMPIVLGVETPDGTHAITVIGHTLEASMTEESIAPFFVLDDKRFYLAAEWAEGFIINDDQRGPYHLVKVVRGKKASSALEVEGLPKRPVRGRRFDVLAAVVPLPLHVYLSAEEALRKAMIAFEFIRSETNEPISLARGNNIVLRHFLVDSNTFKSYQDTVKRNTSEMMVLLNQKRHLPRHLWITEISTLPLWNRRLEAREIIGEILIDPTSNPRHLDCFSVHLCGQFWDMRPEDRDLSDTLTREPISIPDWKPYKPIARSAS